MFEPRVVLSEQERAKLESLVRKGKAPARQISRAQILLHLAEGKPDTVVARAVRCHANTVRRLRRRFAGEGLESTLNERPRPGATPKLDGKGEAFLVALACSAPPEGQSKWTMQLLADRLVTLSVVDDISDETVRRVLKKTSSSRG